VDDSDPDLLFARIVLEATAIAESVRTFGTAAETLAFLQRAEGHEADVILLDINMPEMDGFEFLAAYQQLHTSQQARAVVVMLTSSPNPADRQRAFAFDCVLGYFTKPLQREDALSLIDLVRPPSGTAPA
jgi:CheY-like chemotaxis protein